LELHTSPFLGVHPDKSQERPHPFQQVVKVQLHVAAEKHNHIHVKQSLRAVVQQIQSLGMDGFTKFRILFLLSVAYVLGQVTALLLAHDAGKMELFQVRTSLLRRLIIIVKKSHCVKNST